MQVNRSAPEDLKSNAHAIFLEALSAADVRAAVSSNFSVEGDAVTSAGRAFELKAGRGILTIAIGKAATPMYEAVAEILRAKGWPADRHDAILVSPHPTQLLHGTLRYFAGAHPTPNQTSRDAAAAVLDKLHGVESDMLVLFLVSGGASSMVELPVDLAISERDLAEFNRVLVGSDLSILEINSLRKHLSAVKGGRMAEAAGLAFQLTLIVSDVPASFLDVVGSGPSLPDSSSWQACEEIYERLQTSHRIPQTIARAFARGLAADTPKGNHAAFRKAAWKCILSSDDLSAGAARAASSLGFHVEIDNSCDGWNSQDAAEYLLNRSAQLTAIFGPTCLISVGEVVVNVLHATGIGGRNQHFALQCAIRLQHVDRPVTVLSAGSDGIDGNSLAAGAIATQNTWQRAMKLGIDPGQTLAKFDSFRLFDTLGDSIVLGPTGNNLRDLRLILT